LDIFYLNRKNIVQVEYNGIKELIIWWEEDAQCPTWKKP
jgi:hypothetical protein